MAQTNFSSDITKYRIFSPNIKPHKRNGIEYDLYSLYRKQI